MPLINLLYNVLHLLLDSYLFSATFSVFNELIKLHEAESFSSYQQALCLSRNSPHFMATDGALPLLQEPPICNYSEPEKSSPYPPSHFLKIDFNIIIRLRSWSYRRSCMNLSSFHSCGMPRIFYFSWFYHTSNIWRWVQILITYFSPLPHYLVPFRFKDLPQLPILEIPQPMFLPQYERPSSTLGNKTTGRIMILYILIQSNQGVSLNRTLNYNSPVTFMIVDRFCFEI